MDTHGNTWQHICKSALGSEKVQVSQDTNGTNMPNHTATRPAPSFFSSQGHQVRSSPLELLRLLALGPSDPRFCCSFLLEIPVDLFFVLALQLLVSFFKVIASFEMSLVAQRARVTSFQNHMPTPIHQRTFARASRPQAGRPHLEALN